MKQLNFADDLFIAGDSEVEVKVERLMTDDNGDESISMAVTSSEDDEDEMGDGVAVSS